MISRLSISESTGTEGAKSLLRRVANLVQAFTSERSIRDYLGGDENHIAFKRSSNLEAKLGHRLHIAGIACSGASFFSDLALDQALIPRTDFISPGTGGIGGANLCLSEVSLDEGRCRYPVAQGI